MGQMLIFGLGYAASHLADRLRARGWDVVGTTQDGRCDSIAFADEGAVLAALRSATHILSSVPPVAGVDPVLARYADAIAIAPATWVGYFSSTGVYGDAGGAWVDESAPIKGRRADRNAADAAWQSLRGDVSVFRLPGIYGPGRSTLDRIGEGRAHRRRPLPPEPAGRMGMCNAGLAAAAAANAGRGRPVASGARLLRREPARCEWEGETVARLDAALSEFSGGVAKLLIAFAGATD